ncbi:hypothetical protein GALMADRAFT_208946 [Galerina marginata CBS 339.88]|uniref:Uncharacterized protein n=1 Tax=Galerina marginata (strain CBS 339.88) TaxID=685588 RepID=A0A067TL07_GALM3|nr:hypothetical protein GALMADRAFT_208946 [Galerina marginata CBS 339.88]
MFPREKRKLRPNARKFWTNLRRKCDPCDDDEDSAPPIGTCANNILNEVYEHRLNDGSIAGLCEVVVISKVLMNGVAGSVGGCGLNRKLGSDEDHIELEYRWLWTSAVAMASLAGTGGGNANLVYNSTLEYWKESFVGGRLKDVRGDLRNAVQANEAMKKMK